MNTEVVYRSDGLFLEQVRPPSSRHWQLDGDRMAVGRDPSSAVHVNDASVSWHHAELVRRGLSWSIVDTRSTNGTFVNDARANEAMLHADDRIRLGQIELAQVVPFRRRARCPAARPGPLERTRAAGCGHRRFGC